MSGGISLCHRRRPRSGHTLSFIAEIVAQRLGKSPQYANVYRDRSIREDYILATEYGKVDFKMPYLRDYLRSHAAMVQMRYNVEDAAGSGA